MENINVLTKKKKVKLVPQKYLKMLVTNVYDTNRYLEENELDSIGWIVGQPTFISITKNEIYFCLFDKGKHKYEKHAVLGWHDAIISRMAYMGFQIYYDENDNAYLYNKLEKIYCNITKCFAQVSFIFSYEKKETSSSYLV